MVFPMKQEMIELNSETKMATRNELPFSVTLVTMQKPGS